MSELDDRYQRGQDTRKMFGGGQVSAGSSPGAWEIAPDLERILGEALFGTIWRRPALTPVQREMVTLSCLIVLNREVQLKRHLSNALNVGLSPEQNRRAYHSRHLVRRSSGGHPGADPVQGGL